MLALTSKDNNLKLYPISYPPNVSNGAALIVIENLPKLKM